MRATTIGTRRRFRILFLALFAAAAVVVVTAPPGAASDDGQTDQASGQTEPPHTQIVGGDDVSDGKYPFMAAVFQRTLLGDSGSSARHVCGGTLIYYDAVLTAAHCVEGLFASNLQVTVGRTVLSSDQGEVRNVNRIYMHPEYNSSTNEKDVAVLKLDRPVNERRWILLPGKKQNDFERHGTSLRVAGWGETLTEDGSPDRMRETSVPVLSDFFARFLYGSSFFAEVMVAAGEEGKDTCFGDSGGPLFVKGERHYYQVGITSFTFGEGCGEAGFVGGYTEVNSPSIKRFILSTL